MEELGELLEAATEGLSQAEGQKLVLQRDTGNERMKARAIDTLVRSCLAFVPFKLKRYANRHDYEDILAAGMEGLVIAANKYDGSTKFTTYAGIWIDSKAGKYVYDNGPGLRIPRGHAAARAQIVDGFKKGLTREEMLDLFDMSAELFDRLDQALKPMDSLDLPLPGTDGLFVGDRFALEDPGYELVENEVVPGVPPFQGLTKRDVRDLISRANGMTFDDIGRRYGYTRQRAQQRHAEAKARVQRNLDAQNGWVELTDEEKRAPGDRRECKLPGCQRVHYGRGLCRKHYDTRPADRDEKRND